MHLLLRELARIDLARSVELSMLLCLSTTAQIYYDI